MIITAIVKDKSKYRVYIDEVYAFSLYPKELTQYAIELNGTISEAVLKKINEEIIIKRGIIYINHLLSKKDYTYRELMQKLLNAGIIQTNAEIIINKFMERGLISDLKYVKRYFESMQQQKSFKEMIYILKNKGIEMTLISQVMETLEVNEYDAALKMMHKKVKGKTDLTYEEKAKLYNYLVNKGFTSETIRAVMGTFNE